jgi:tetratricopeptide (TPR) repeat protein
MNEQRYLLFDQYLHNEMTAEERNLFENQLATDMKFKSEFETFREVRFQLENKFAAEKDREAFKATLNAVSKEYFKTKTPKAIQFKPWYFAAAASVAVLLGFFFFNQNAHPAFEDFNHPEKAYFTERGNLDALLKQAETAFNAKDYQTAIPIFETILTANKTSEIQYFYGVALLQENQLEKAEAVFTELKSGTSVYKEKALWNLALLKLKQKDYKGSKEILQTISEDYEDYGEVQELLDALD